MMVSTPAARTGSICSMVSTSTSKCVVWPELGLGAAQHRGQLRRVAAGEDGQVVVLGQDGVGEAEAVVGAAAAADGVAFEHPQPRRRLAGIGDPRPGAVHERHELGRFGGDGAHPLDQVQGDAFGQQHGAGVPGHAGQGGSGGEGLAVGDQQFDDGARVGQLHRRGEDLPAAEHAGNPGVENRRRPRLRGDERLRGDVPVRGVLLQRRAQDGQTAASGRLPASAAAREGGFPGQRLRGQWWSRGNPLHGMGEG